MQEIYRLQKRSPHIFLLLVVIFSLTIAYGIVASLLFIPQSATATVCGTGSNVTFTDIGGGQCRAFITSGTSFTVPSDWSNTSNSIEVIGGGGGGSGGNAGNTGSGSGGGGAYSKISNLSLTPGASITYAIGVGGTAGTVSGNGGAGGDTWFNGNSFAVSSVAAQGAGGGVQGGTGGAGGAAGSSIGITKYSGGAGGFTGSGRSSGSGGGGAAGPNGTGGAGGSTPAGGTGGGAGGGGNGGGSAGSQATVGSIGGAGGNNSSGSGGGAGGTVNIGSNGLSGGGGGGGFSGGTAGAFGGNGGNGIEWDATHGSGGGGGGAGGNTTNIGGTGGLYGGGGGGGASGSGQGIGGSGKQGIIVITYTPFPAPGVPGTPTFASVTQTTMTVNWTAATGATTYKVERCAGAGCSSFAQIASGVAAATYNDSGLTANTSYSYRIRGTNAGGDGSYSGTGTQTTAVAAPGSPGTPTFSGITLTGARVSWTAASGADSYSVERCSGAGCSTFSPITSGVVGLFYDDSGLTTGTSYTYRVIATNIAGNGPYSGAATLVAGVPDVPGTPTFSNVTNSGIHIAWTASPRADSYSVERCSGAGCSNFSQVTSGVTALFYDDTGLTNATSYTYRIRATNTYGNSPYSGSASQVTGSSGLGTPGTPTFSVVTSSGMRVSWSAVSGATSYSLERCTGAGCSSFAIIVLSTINTSYDDSALNAGTSYTYRVRASNGSGVGPYSNSATQVTSAAGAATGVDITGWLWAEGFIDRNGNGVEDAGDVQGGVGWVSTNCKTGGPTAAIQSVDICSSYSYGLKIDPATGVITGQAWSDNIGWISADSADVAYCKTNFGGGNPTISGGNVSGWLRALSGNGSQSGGWDGCLSLSGSGYGVTYVGGNFAGYAWGSSNVGWVDFSRAHSTYNTCTLSTVYTCSGQQTVVRTDTDVACRQTLTNTSCVAPQFCSVGSPVCLTPQPRDLTGTGSLTGHLTAQPNLVAKNATTTLYWGIVNIQPGSCRVTANDGTSWSGPFSATSSCPTKYSTGCTSLPITQQIVFTLSCLDFNSVPYSETAAVNLLPDFQEK